MLFRSSAEDAALAARIAPVIADDGAGEEEPESAGAAAAAAAQDRWTRLKWGVWAAIVLAIALVSRSALSSRPPPGSSAGPT